ncbi:Exocyst complex component 6B [Nymphon striatum]|nr:Exocyst complex component 6B [Nymphon striatum]
MEESPADSVVESDGEIPEISDDEIDYGDGEGISMEEEEIPSVPDRKAWHILTKSELEQSIKARHLFYLDEIECTEGVFATSPTLRAIYDGDEHQKFMERLDTRIKSHDRDIERMCNFHYQGFIESIRELLKVRTEAQKLKYQVTQTNSDLHDSGKKVIERGQELVRHQKILHNIGAAINGIHICLPVLEMYAKMNKQMKEKRYYPALKTLEQLEHTYLPRVSKYRFSQTMKSQIPQLRENIKEASMSDLKDFLENIRKHSAKIGEVAMKHTAEQDSLDPTKGVNQPSKKIISSILNPFDDQENNVENDEAEGQFDDEEVSAQDLVDFSPVYRCLHIYSVLGSRDTFETYYRSQRKKQASFFVVEDHILNTANGLVNRQYLDEVWETALSKIVGSLTSQCVSLLYRCWTYASNKRANHVVLSYTSALQLVLICLNLLDCFCAYSFKGYGYQVTQLFDLLIEIRDQYNEILMKQWVTVFRKIFDDDNYHPIQVNNQAEFQSIIKMFPYNDAALEKAPFPKRCPFSMFVPKIFSEIKEFMFACLKFSEDLGLRCTNNPILEYLFSHTEVDDMVRKSTNFLLTRTLSGCLSSLIKKPNLGLLQLIQITINSNYLEDASVYMERILSEITGASSDGSHVAKLQGRSMFKDARADAEAQIYQALNKKIDEFLELATYDWMVSDSRGHASSYMMDLIAFLQSTFLSFTNLPDKVAQTACMSACKHISTAMMSFLMDEEVKQLSMGSLQQFNLDLIQCEQFASSEPVQGFEEGALQMCFAELRQLLDLFMSWDWSIYFSDFGSDNSKYLRVNPQTAIILLEKLKEADKKKNFFSSMSKSERDKKKLIETVLKQLRQITANAGL